MATEWAVKKIVKVILYIYIYKTLNKVYCIFSSTKRQQCTQQLQKTEGQANCTLGMFIVYCSYMQYFCCKRPKQ